MQKGKRFFYVLATLLAIMPIASCKMDGGDIKAASIEIEKEQTKGSTLIIRTNVSTQEQTTTNSRSAVPSKLVDTGGNQLVFAGALYASDAQEKDKKFQKGEYNNGSLTLTFESSEEDRIDYTLEIRAYKGGTEDFDGKHLLYGTTTVTIKVNKTEINAPSVQLTPCYEGEPEDGNVNLKILIPSEYILDVVGFSLDESNEQENGYKKYIIYAERKKAGIYEVDFFLWNLNKTSVVYLWREAINVYPGMTTDKWNTGSVKDGARQIDKAKIFSTFYVVGEDPQSKWFTNNSRSSTEENGSLSHPFTSIQKAIDKVLAINDESTPFSIYIDGTLDGTTVAHLYENGMADFSALDKSLTLTIKSLSETTKATLDGGARFDENGNITNEGIEKSVIYAAPGSGKLDLTLENLVITGGNSTESGGGIHVENSNFTMKDGSITGNTASQDGGGIYIDGGTLTMTGGTIGGNTANKGGGIYVTGSKQATISGTTISGNIATVDGGGVFVSDCKLTMNGTISGNTAQQGGGVYVRYNKGVFMMTGGKISGNKTTNETATEKYKISGGGIFIYGGAKATISNAMISENDATNNGGGVFVNKGMLEISAGATISSNTVSSDGGGVYVFSGKFEMKDGTISGNEAKGSTYGGGGVYVHTGQEFTMSDGTISGNTATKDGGGVYSNNGIFEMTGGTIGGDTNGDKNTAQYGGGVYLMAGGNTFTMSGGEISGNKASEQGGGVYVNSTKFSMSGSAKVNGNTATESGGGIYVYKDSASTTDAVFTMACGEEGEISGNTATTGNGGGIYNQGGIATIHSGKISRNKTTSVTTGGNGGGVYNASGTFTMNGGTIGGDTTSDKNTAQYGGGVFVKGGTFTMDNNSKIINNNATTGGGGVSLNGGTFTMKDGIFSGNNANQGKGVYYNNNGRLEMSDKANFNKDDNVYIYGSSTIWIAGTLEKDFVATITLPDSYYVADKQVLSAGTGVTITQSICDKFAVTPQTNGTKWKVALSVNTGVLKKDNVSPDDNSGNGISVTIDGVGTYTFKLEAGNTEVTEGSPPLQPGTNIKLSEVKDSSGKALTSSDGTFSIEIRDESGITYPDASASATGFQCTATVPQVPPDGMPAQIYVKVELNDNKTVIDKTIPVTIIVPQS